MAKMKFDLGDLNLEETEVRESAAGYDGERPPKGIYRCVTKKMQLMLNKKNGPMVMTIAEIAEKSGPKAQYNGYTFYDYQNISKQSAPYILGQFKALFDEATARTFLREGPNLDGGAPKEPGRANAVDIKSIGKVKLLDANGAHKPIVFRANTTLGAKSEQYEQRLEIRNYLPASDTDKAISDEGSTETEEASASAAPPSLDDEEAPSAAPEEPDESDEEEDTTEDDEDLDGEAPF